MKYFKEITSLPFFDLYEPLNNLLFENIISFGQFNQICLNATQPNSYNYQEGIGSLRLDWTSKSTDNKGEEKYHVKEKQNCLNETDFKYLCAPFRNTIFEKVYEILVNNYNLGRVRIMKSKPKTCLSWHIDYHKRIHLPIKTQEGSFMVIEDEVKHLDYGKWWDTDTQRMHTAVNASKEERIHLVATVISKKI